MAGTKSLYLLLSSMKWTTVSALKFPWEQDPDTDDVFTWLRPLNEPACEAFHLVVEDMINNESAHLHEGRFSRRMPGCLDEQPASECEEARDRSKSLRKYIATIGPKLFLKPKF